MSFDDIIYVKKGERETGFKCYNCDYLRKYYVGIIADNRVKRCKCGAGLNKAEKVGFRYLYIQYPSLLEKIFKGRREKYDIELFGGEIIRGCENE